MYHCHEVVWLLPYQHKTNKQFNFYNLFKKMKTTKLNLKVYKIKRSNLNARFFID
jgi:hypothetical protein